MARNGLLNLHGHHRAPHDGAEDDQKLTILETAVLRLCRSAKFTLTLNPPEAQIRRYIGVDRETLLLPSLRDCRRRGTRRRRW